MHKHFIKSVKLKTVLFHDWEDGERHTKQHSDALEEEKVPNHQYCFQRYLVDKDLHEPWESQQVCIETDFIKVNGQLGMPLLHKVVEYFLVNEHPEKTSEVVEREVDFDYLAQNPEGFFLC